MIYKRGCDKKGPGSSCSKCGKRGSYGVYWYKFMWQGKLVRESSEQGTDRVARQIEAAHKTSLAKGEVGNTREEARPDTERILRQQIRAVGQGDFRAHLPQ